MAKTPRIGRRAMRITDSRYDRDRLRLAIAYRLIALRRAPGPSGWQRSCRTTASAACTATTSPRSAATASAAAGASRRARCPSSAARSSTSSRPPLLGALLRLCGLLAATRRASGRCSRTSRASATSTRPTSASGPAHMITFEHAWHLLAGVLPQRRVRAGHAAPTASRCGCGTRWRSCPTTARPAGAVCAATLTRHGRRAR